ncbi:MAG: hypothetical protein JXP34_11905, partial [Planctomycetes bacterium]|nr:hypothetical protein [Planctomycetota bacterium]
GYIRRWLLLGEFIRGGWSNPGAYALGVDYLTDGVISEINVLPMDGDEIATDYFGASPACGLDPASTLGDADRDGAPEWFAWDDPDDTINYNDVFGDRNSVMTYACAYVVNSTGAAIDCRIGISGDDSVAVYINTDPVYSVDRAGGYGDARSDLFTAAARILPGKNRVLVKCFDGNGTHGIRFRFRDAYGDAVTYGLDVSLDPTDCVVPPVAVRRELPAQALLRSELPVALKAMGRGAGTVTIRETVPAGFEILDAAGGTVAGQTITWTKLADAIGTTTYRLRVPDEPFGTATFAGTYRHGGGAELPIFGPTTVTGGGGVFGTDGFITQWLLVGPLVMDKAICSEVSGTCGGAGQLPCCSAPGDAEIALDYLAEDGGEYQETILPYAGMWIDVDYGGEAASVDYLLDPGGAVPVIAWYDNDGAINYNNEVWPPDPQGVMAYAFTYLENTTGADLEVYLGFGSDDSFEVWLDDEVVSRRNITPTGRAWAWPDVQDRIGPVTLRAGVQHRLMTKVFEGWGGWGFYLRLEDETGAPIATGVEVSLDPEGGPVDRPRAIRSLDPLHASSGTIPVAIDVTGQGNIAVEEIVPDGWTISNITAGGAAAGQVISWTVNGAAQLRYDAKAPAVSPRSEGIAHVWSGTVTSAAGFFPIGGGSQSTGILPDGDASPWKALDIGPPLPGGVELLSGSATEDDPMEMNVWGGGRDVWNGSDSFRFVYIERSDAFRITAEIPYQDDTNAWCKAGAMVRSSLCATSAYAFMFATPGQGNDFQYRLTDTANAANVADGQTGAGNLYPWVRLEKVGNTFTGYRSFDGIEWEPHQSAQTISGPADGVWYVGLAVCSHDSAAIAGVEFRNVSIESIPICPTGVKAVCDAEGVHLSWTNHYAYSRVRVYRVDATGFSKRVASLAGAPEAFDDTRLDDDGVPTGTVTYRIVPMLGTTEIQWCADCPGEGGAGAVVCVHWPSCAPVACCGSAATSFIRSDTDGNGILTIGDGIQILERLFVDRPRFGSNCEKTGDFDDSGALEIGDAISVFNLLFVPGSRLPKPPYPACGADPTEDDLPCMGPIPGCP